MRRTNSRSSTRSGARRASSSRSKRSKRPARPRLSTRQVREIFGVLLMLAALLGLLAIASHAGSILTGIRDGMVAGFGSAWFVPVVAAIALSAYLLWPKAPRPRGVDIVAGIVAVLSLVGLFGLAAGAGGSIGRGVDSALTGPFTTPGAWALLIAGLVIGLIVTIHFSPGALLVSTVGALRAANSERVRLSALVAAAPADKSDKIEKQKATKAVPASADALTRSAASFATTPATSEQRNVWDIDEPEAPREAEVERPRTPVAVEDEPPEPLKAPVMRVVAEAEDDIPDIDWKLPSITLLDTVTARRERMADEIKRNVRVMENTLQQFGVEAKVIGVNPGPAVTQY